MHFSLTDVKSEPATGGMDGGRAESGEGAGVGGREERRRESRMEEREREE